MARRAPASTLSAAQLELLSILWERGPSGVADVWDCLQQRRPVARNTVQTMLSRLERKGWLTHREVNGAFIYSPTASREHVQHGSLNQLLDTVFHGSATGLVLALLQDRTLSREEASRIRKLIKQAEEQS